MLAFLAESRRVSNRRMLDELGVQLTYPTMQAGIRASLAEMRLEDIRIVTFSNPPPAAIQRLLATSKIIAVIGLSDNPARPSYDVSQSMRGFGYRILPVNPSLTVVAGAARVSQPHGRCRRARAG